ncbi:tyrosine-type recombinase/integrase [Gryllotalpicola sp.]|uniref:tyrosine-type recombinase/integrase n=1 Tax=Gryllotalpicola sp. TaxID=1932787 RepID=UPI0026351A8E|nr:tyrosine-type recombinase/integrase [Gryllotalpicola sp.]
MLTDYEAYLTIRRKSPNTIKLRLGYMRRLSATYNPATVTTAQLRTFIDFHEWSPSTEATVVATFHSFFSWARRSGLRNDDPSENIIAPRVPKHPARIAQDAALIDGWEIASDDDRAMILLAAECGLRVSEIASLHMDNRRGDCIDVFGKGSKWRTEYLSPELIELLDKIERERTRGHYFRMGGNRHLHPSTVWRRIKSLTGYNTHALRHRGGTAVYRGTGKDIRLAQEFLGHASPLTTAIYVHIQDDDLRRAADAARLFKPEDIETDPMLIVIRQLRALPGFDAALAAA